MASIFTIMNCKSQDSQPENLSQNSRVYRPLVPIHNDSSHHREGLRSILDRNHRSNTPISKQSQIYSSNRISGSVLRNPTPLLQSSTIINKLHSSPSNRLVDPITHPFMSRFIPNTQTSNSQTYQVGKEVTSSEISHSVRREPERFVAANNVRIV